jgi:hypothetical protein
MTMDFALFGRTQDKIFASDYLGSAFLYDDALRAVYPLPSMKDGKQDYPVSLAVGDDLLVMSKVPHPFGHSVEALIDHTFWWPMSELRWHSVSPPPFVKPEEELDDCSWYSDLLKGSIETYTAVGDSHVWISAPSYGTYSFDMRKESVSCSADGHPFILGKWSKVGDWVLPFQGRAVYAPELSRWFGFSKRDKSILCAVDLQQAGAAKPPMVSDEWEGFTVPKAHYQVPIDSFLVHLGTSGRFCIAKFSENRKFRKTAMLTGVEVTRCGDGEPLRLVKHKTYRYAFADNHPICVL